MSDVVVRVNKSDINYVVRILEGYEYLGVVTTIDPRVALIKVRAVFDTENIVREVLESLPVEIDFIEM